MDLEQGCSDGLEEADLVADGAGLVGGSSESERLGQGHDGVGIAAVRALLALVRRLLGGVFLRKRQNPLHRAGHDGEARLRRRGPVQRRAIVEAADRVGPEHRLHDLIPLQHLLDGFRLVDAGLVAVAAGILAERALQVLGDADVIHHQAGGFVAEHAIDTRDGLHQAVALHRLVHIHGVHAGRVEAGQPHVAHDDQFQRVLGVLGPLGDALASRLGPLADVRLPLQRIGGRAGHDDLDRARIVVVAVPRGPQFGDGVIERHADTAAHADDHALAVERLGARLEMLDQILGDQRDAFVRADQRLDAGPFALQALLLALRLVLSQVRDLAVDLRLLVLVEFDPRQPAFVIDRHGGAILDGAADVVNVDVVAEDGGRVDVLLLDRRSR